MYKANLRILSRNAKEMGKKKNKGTEEQAKYGRKMFLKRKLE